MPFDVMPTDKPTLESLSYLLRHEEMWPAGFKWNFGHCDTCAMGMIVRLVGGRPEEADRHEIEQTVDKTLGISRTERSYLFDRRAIEDLGGNATPTQIADRIDAYLASRR